MEAELQTFIETKTGKSNVGDTKENIGECVGLIEVWLDTLHLPHIWGNAIDLLDNADPNVYEVILNTTTNFPVACDIIVFKKPFGQYTDTDGTIKYLGHTGVVVAADVNSVTVFEQNNPEGSTPRTVVHSYNSVKGWLHVKNFQATDPTLRYTQAEMDVCMVDRTTFWQERDSLQVQLDKANQDLHNANNKLTPFIVSGYNTVDDINTKIEQITKDNTDLYTENKRLLASNGVLAGQVEKVSTEDSKTAELGQSYIDTNKDLNDFITELSKELGAKSTEAKSMFARVFELRDQAEQWLKTLPQEEQNIIEKVKIDGVKWLMNLLNLSKIGKGGE